MRVSEPDVEVPPEYDRLLGAKTGVITSLVQTSLSRAGPNVHVGATDPTNIARLHGGRGSIEMEAGGKALTARQALRAAIGETVERYCLWWPQREALFRASYEELAAREETAIPGFEFLIPWGRPGERVGSETEFTALTRTATVDWVEGTNLLTGEPTAVPADMVWNKVGVLSRTDRHFPGTSNGVAAGETLEDALLGALYEVVERDGFMATWYREQTPPSVDVAGIPELAALAERLLPRADVSLRAFGFDSLVDVPTYGAALVHEEASYPKFAISGAAHLDPVDAVADALVESCQAWPYMVQVVEDHDLDAMSLDDEIWNFTENVLQFADPRNFEHVEFLLDGEPVRPEHRDVPDDELGALLARLDDAGCTPVAYEITTNDVAESGIRVVRVVVPELIPFSPPSLHPTNHPRLRDHDCQRLPHPYP